MTAFEAPASEWDVDSVPPLESQYTVESQLTNGGWGAILRAHRVNHQGPYVVKRFLRTKGDSYHHYVRGCVNEYRTMKRAGSASAAVVYGLFVDREEILCMAMDLYSYGDLLGLLSKIRRLKLNTSHEFKEFNFFQIVKAVKHLHAVHVVHRDLKPENVLISGDGTLRLTDFGYAVDLDRLDDYELTRDFLTCGTTSFKAPELFQKRKPLKMPSASEFRALDVWSLAILYYQIRTANKPWMEASPDDPCYREWATKYKDQKMDRLDGYSVRRLLTSDKKLDSGFGQMTQDEMAVTVVKMLNPDTSKRIDLQDVYMSEWLIQVRLAYERYLKTQSKKGGYEETLQLLRM